LNADGSFDTSFGTGGTQTVAFDLGGDKADQLAGLVIQPDGKLVLAGQAVTSTTPTPTGYNISSDFAVARLHADGSLDTTFGTNGKVAFGFGIGGNKADAATAIALQADGKIVLAGVASVSLSSTGSDQWEMAAARLVGSPPPPSTVGVFDPATATW